MKNIDWKDETILLQLKELVEKGLSSKEIASIMTDSLGRKVGDRAIRRVSQENGFKLQKSNNNGYNSQDKVQEERHADGTIDRKGYLEMSEAELMDDDFVLKAHGFNPKNYKIINIKNSFWQQGTKDGNKSLYASKITVKPIVGDFDPEKFIQNVVEKTSAYKPKKNEVEGYEQKYLVIPAFDTHFDGKTLDSYKKSLDKQIDIINMRNWSDITLILGGDIAHIDNTNSTTTSGTQLDTTDLADTVTEMEKYFEPLIEYSITRSKHVQVLYAKGNHDITVGYMFARMMEKRYSDQENIDFDISLSQYKGYLMGHNFIAATHGNKGQKNYVANFASRFALEWGSATNRELFTGHLHNEMSKDLGGFIQRQVSTRKPTDKWTDDLGVVSTKNFEVVSYGENETEAIFYV